MVSRGFASLGNRSAGSLLFGLSLQGPLYGREYWETEMAAPAIRRPGCGLSSVVKIVSSLRTKFGWVCSVLPRCDSNPVRVQHPPGLFCVPLMG